MVGIKLTGTAPKNDSIPVGGSRYEIKAYHWEIEKLGNTDDYYGKEGINFYKRIGITRYQYSNAIEKHHWELLNINDYEKLVEDKIIRKNKHIENLLNSYNKN